LCPQGNDFGTRYPNALVHDPQATSSRRCARRASSSLTRHSPRPRNRRPAASPNAVLSAKRRLPTNSNASVTWSSAPGTA